MTLEHGGCQGKENGRELERRRSEGAGCKNPDETLGLIGILENITYPFYPVLVAVEILFIVR